MKPLVTGAAGFAGSHLIELLSSRVGEPIDGSLRPDKESIPKALVGKLRVHALDVDDAAGCVQLLEAVRPTHVFHLAGPAHVGDSFAQAPQVARTIYAGTVNLLEAAARLSPAPRVLLVSSAEVYGESAKRFDPLTEESPTLPDTPYGVSKLAAEAYGTFLARSGRVPVVISRSFNHLGPRQSDRFATASFARQIAEAETRGEPGEIKVGNLAAERDVLDVRDVVKGYQLLAERGVAGEIYNLASGRSVRMSELLEKLVARSRVRMKVVADPARFRPVDIPGRRGSADKVRALGWLQTYSLEQTLEDLLASWRGKDR